MLRHLVERSTTLILSFTAGAVLAMCTAPGDVLLWVATVLVLGLFCRAFFVRNTEASWFGSFLLNPGAPTKNTHRPKVTVTPR